MRAWVCVTVSVFVSINTGKRGSPSQVMFLSLFWQEVPPSQATGNSEETTEQGYTSTVQVHGK